jgi:hypothetical protein
LKAVKELNERTSTVLARQMSENHSRDVRMLDPLVDEADAGVMDCYDCVAAIGCYILDKTVGIVVYRNFSYKLFHRRSRVQTSKADTIGTFCGKCIDEYKAGVGGSVDGGLGGSEVPKQTCAILIGLLLKCVEGR